VALSNPSLASLISSRIGDDWVRRTDGNLKKLEEHADDPVFLNAWREVKLQNKTRMAAFVKERIGITLNPESMFDVQVKRIHEYKRQDLNVLNIVTLYDRLKKNPGLDLVPRTFIFGGKAAPSYFMAKLIIKLINSVASVVNNDPDVADKIKVAFIPNFNVKNGHQIYPAAELSEQISTAGKEASGTGNMKFAMNGALTIGTLDGANIEIMEEVGESNFFLFGLTATEVQKLKSEGYNPRDYYDSNENLRSAIGLIGSGYFSDGDTSLFRPFIDSLLYHDEYMVFADYQSYVDRQDRISQIYLDKNRWTKMSVLNTARMGKFSSDRAVEEYCNLIWGAGPIDWSD
jgi:starch phosphorylase